MKKLLIVLMSFFMMHSVALAEAKTVDATEIITEFERNCIRFEKNYIGQRVTVSGLAAFVVNAREELERIGNGKYVVGLLNLDTPSYNTTFPVFFFKTSDDIIELSTNDEVTIEGICMYGGKIEGVENRWIVFQDCKVIKK
ncbi:MAG: OB-fold putative lipoprotein [Elusimicrobiota bacterium]|nr:OB-fold putative lipoprotein [Elusimicrobiota bacterium]